MRKLFCLLICLGILALVLTAFTGCMIPYNVDIEKFPVYPETMGTFPEKGFPIKIVMPENVEEKYIVENLNSLGGRGLIIMIDLNDMYRTANELIQETLDQKQIQTDNSSAKYLKYTVDKIQYETWGWVYVQGCYFYFTVETSDGYKHQYKVQDQSGYSFDRAISGAISRSIERMFQDQKVLNFIGDR